MSYQTLKDGFREWILLGEGLALLEWDSAVMMPATAGGRRAAQMACLDAVIHDKIVSLDQILQTEVKDCPENPWDQANLNEMQRIANLAVCVPKKTQVALSEARQNCEMRWREARSEQDFSVVMPYWAEVVDLSREALTAQSEKMGVSLLDAAISGFEPGLKADQAENLLEEHAGFIHNFLPVAVENAQRRRQDFPLNWTASTQKQDYIARAVCYRVGLNPQASRIDVSTHPFSTGSANDARVTVRFDENRALSAISAAIHETGHALYEMQLPAQWNDQPVGQSRGMVLHESQSLAMEMQAGRSKEFLQWLSGYLAQDCHSSLSFNALCAESWFVEPSPIRVDADEVTYPLHVLLRFRIEKDLLSGKLKVKDVPEAFRCAQKELLGLEIDNDGEGCLQDIHWYMGAFGYFPCYALGAMASAQLYQAALQDKPEIPKQLSKGDFSGVKSWMGQNVHAIASLQGTNDILQKATNASLGCTALQDHLIQRYGTSS